jgi:Na+/proline symporter
MGWLAVLYSLFLVGMGRWISGRRGADLGAFYNARRQAHWVWVGLSMIGTAISGLTFLSLPGAVRQDGWTYLQVLLGYLVGYTLVALVLLPQYYRLSQASIYEYFRHRLGPRAEKVAAITFLVSRLIASSVRLYLALVVLQLFFPQLPFPLLGLFSLMLIYGYAERGGTGTIIYTDVFQTLLFLGAAIFTLGYVLSAEVWEAFQVPKIIEFSSSARHYFWKDFLGGVLLAFTMTGLDQDQMQKSLSMSDVSAAQRMLMLYAGLLVPVKLLFLVLGSALWAYVEVEGYAVPARSDQLYAYLAKEVFPFWIGALFVIGLVSSTFSSVDGALVALTTVTLRNLFPPGRENLFLKRVVFIGWLLLSWGVTVYFHYFPPERYALDTFLKLGSYTYGPLLGLFFFSLIVRRLSGGVDRRVPAVVLGSFGVAIGMEHFLGMELGYGVIVWVAGWVVAGLTIIKWVWRRVK